MTAAAWGAPGTNVGYHVGVEFTANSGYIELRDRVVSAVINHQMSGFGETFAAGTAEIRLRNEDGQLGIRTAVGSYAGRIRPGLNMRVWGLYRTDSGYAGGTDMASVTNINSVANFTLYPLFTGVIDEWRTDADYPFEVTISGRDLFSSRALARRVNAPTMAETDARSYLAVVMSLAGLTSQVSLESAGGAEVYDTFKSIFMEPDATVGDILTRVMEAGFYSAWVRGDASLFVRGRYWRHFPDNLNLTFSDFNVTSCPGALGSSYTLALDRVINAARVTAEVREASTAVATVAFLSAPVRIEGSAHVAIFLDYAEPTTFEPCPAMSLETLVASQDYYATTNSLGTGIDRTSTLSVTATFFATTMVATLFNGHSDVVYVNRLQARGFPLLRRSPIVSEVVNSSSQALYGRRETALVNNFIGTQIEADGLSQYLAAVHGEPIGTRTLSVRNGWPACFGATIGMSMPLVTSAQQLTMPQSHADGGTVAHIVTAVEHVIDGREGRFVHTVNLTGEQVELYDNVWLPFIVGLSNAGGNLAGTLGSGRLG